MATKRTFFSIGQSGDSSMALILRRLRWLLLAIVFVVVTYTLFGDVKSSFETPASVPPVRESTKQPADPLTPESGEVAWEFDVERDGLNYGLSDGQCETAFPDLYQELDRARDFLLNRNLRVKESDLNLDAKGDYTGLQHGEFHAMISKGELYVIEERKGEPDRSRGLAALASLYRAIVAMPNARTLPNIEFIIDIEDRAARGEKNPKRIRWAWAREEKNEWLWVMPDFDGWSYPDDGVGSYVQFREDAREVENDYKHGWDDKKDKLCWRGSLAVNRKLRTALVDAAAGNDWNDVEAIDWHNRSNILDMRDFCRYKYVVHTEGNSWSGRLRYLHNCESVPVIHKLDYVFHYRPLLQDSGPHQNYVKVKRDWSDLTSQMSLLLADPNRARRVAQETTKVFRDRYLTPAAEACYWRRMIHNWRAVMDFEPQQYHTKKDGSKVRRGVSWERFAFRQKQSFEHGFFEPDGDNDDEEDGSR